MSKIRQGLQGPHPACRLLPSRQIGRLPGCCWRFGLAATLFVVASCARDTTPAASSINRLFADSFSEARFTYERDTLEERIFDFTAMSSAPDLHISGARYRFGPNGLVISRSTNIPHLVFAPIAMPINMIRIEMSSSSEGLLNVFWSNGELPFARDRKKHVAVGRSNDFKSYEIELWNELDTSNDDYRIRIDPIDRQADVRIKAVTFRHYIRTPTKPIQIGKVKIGREIREAIMLRADASIERTIYGGGKEKTLQFGLARLQENQGSVDFEITISGPGYEHLLFHKKVDTGNEVEWRDYRVDFSACPMQRCMVTLAATSDEESEFAPAVFVSNPLVVSPGRRRLPNVILISLDTLGARYLSAYGAAKDISPSIGDFAKRGVVFENSFANAPVTHTSHASMLTGSAPFATPYHWLDGVVDNEVTLADALRRNGYLTAAFTAGVLVSEDFGFDKGFESFYQHDTLYRPLTDRSDIEPITSRSLSWIEQHPTDPVFLFLHTYEVHSPYIHRNVPKIKTNPSSTGNINNGYYDTVYMRGRLPADRAELPRLVMTLSETGREVTLEKAEIPLDQIEPVRQAYESEIRFLDRIIGRFLESLRSLGALDDAIMVITADHGEAFFEHGLLSHGILYDENLRIPIILWAPDHLPSGKRVAQQVSSMDIAPTILDLLGLSVPPEMEGRSLIPLITGEDEADRDFYSFAPGNGLSWQTNGRYKAIVRAGLEQENFGMNEFFDLAKDPFEQRNLLLAGVEIPKRLQRQMRRTIEHFPGIHIDFGALAGTTYEIEFLEFPAARGIRFYAFDVIRESLPSIENPAAWRSRLTFSERSQLVVHQKGRQRLSFRLHPTDGEKPLTFVIETLHEQGKKELLPASTGEGGPVLRVWRVGELADESPSILSPEEQEKLRALGYL